MGVVSDVPVHLGPVVTEGLELAGEWETDRGPMPVPGNWWLAGHDVERVTYRRTVNVPGDGWVLRFAGVDYFCSVNGGARHEGYFDQFEVPVEPGRQDLEIVVEAPREEFGTVWPYRKRQLKGIFGQHDCRPGTDTERGQDRTTGGIWAPVRLLPGTPLEVTAVRTTLDGPHADVEIVVNLDLADVRASLDGEGLADGLRGRVKDARLWWPWDQGEPNRYRLVVEGRTADGRDVACERMVGLRTVELRDGMKLHVNGRRVFIRGSNWCGTQWLSELTPEFAKRDASLALQANLNALRVHGHVSGPAFYDACDESGILVWQDFPMQWGYDEDVWDEAHRQAGAMVDLLGWRPSVFLWCVHNESPWFEPWLTEETGVPDQNRELDLSMAALVGARDPARPVVENSGARDAHLYPGWYFGRWQDYRELIKGGNTIVSEYGAQALPNLDSLRRFLPEGSMREDWEFHDFQPAETYRYLGIPPGVPIENLIEASQAYQAKVIQFATEVYRRARWRFCDGLFQFWFVDCWPSVTWSVLDWWREPKLGFDSLRRSMQPVLPSIEMADDRLPAGEPVRFGLWVVNDLAEDFLGTTLSWRVGEHVGSLPVDVRADEARRVAVCGPFGLRPGPYTVEAALTRADGAPLGENAWAFRIERESQG